MSTTTRTTDTFSCPKPDWLWWSMLALVMAGLGVSGYLLWGYTTPGAVLACGGSHGCETVRNSPYSSILGISLPVIGLASYLTLLALLLAHRWPAGIQRDWLPCAALALFGIAFAGVLFSAYLIYLELFVIYAICRWCVASAVIVTAIFVLSIFNLQRVNRLSMT